MSTRLKYGFSVISNIRNPINRSINRRTITYDSYIARYQDIHIMAYTDKRRIKKQEVPSKILIEQLQIPEIQTDLQKQLQDGISTIPLNIMAIQYERCQITSSYIFSKFSQKGLKQLLQNYSRKILLNGKMPPMSHLQSYNQYLQKIIKLYKIYYYGQELSQLQQFIESQYLTLKLNKYNNYLKSGQKSIKKRNQYLKCIWNDENQRSLEGYRNWQSRPFDDYADFRPFFNQIFIVKNQNNDENISENLIVQPDDYLNKQNVEFVAIQLFNRIIEWCACLEFNRILKLPVDFMIELSIISTHVWMLLSRLGKEKNTAGLIRSLQSKFKSLIRNKLGDISYQTGTIFDQDVYNRFLLHWKALQLHFKNTPNVYENLDTLVYNTVFLSKISRDSDTIPIFSQYLKSNYQIIQTLPIQTILTGKYQFDAYVISPDYKSNFKTSSLNSYPFQNQLSKILQPLSKPDLKLSKPTLGTKLYRWMLIMTRGLKEYDYYSEVQKQQKQNQSLKSIGWNLDQNIDQEFDTVQKLRLKNKK